MSHNGGPPETPGRPNGFPSLPMLDDDLGPVDSEDRPTVLVTGACGYLGRKLRAQWGDRYDLILLDRNPGPDDDEVIPADLAELDDEWAELFHGVDAVVHLAAHSHPDAPWGALVGPNLDTLPNVLNAAVLAAVDRFVFASSSHTMWGYRDDGPGPISEDLPPRPDGPFGASKLAGERFGRGMAQAFELTFVALRIGWVQPDPNHPSTLPDDWARSLWLSDRDLAQLVECALWSELDERFLVVNGTSRNLPSRWPITRAVELLGYSPLDDAFAPSGAG
ncbi:NAD(P)-dependent oxidoreductase [Tautonia sp. JC769]|uniref:NAD-dependent epimerase/dehydratase family protein n=1 Tax=Tautonia sp. JC769 TaxID=3232135 RepID=UPI0034579EB9